MSGATSLAERFAELSAVRDVPAESQTESRGFTTADGYVHEVISSSANQQTVTKRVTVTQATPMMSHAMDPSGSLGTVATAPVFKYNGGQSSGLQSSRLSNRSSPTTSSVSSFPAATLIGAKNVVMGQAIVHQSGAVRPLPPPKTTPASMPAAFGDSASPLRYTAPVEMHWVAKSPSAPSATPFATSRGAGPIDGQASPAPTTPIAPQPREVESLGNMRWVTTVSPTASRHASALRGGGEQSSGEAPREKSVRIGGSSTTLVEPSRVSPVMVRDAYAPVRYVSKREMRAMQRRMIPDDENHDRWLPRRGSVPRLDAYLEEQAHLGREFDPTTAVEDTPSRGRSAGRRRMQSPPPPFESAGAERVAAARQTTGYRHEGGSPYADVAYGEPMDPNLQYFDDGEAWESVSQRSYPPMSMGSSASHPLLPQRMSRYVVEQRREWDFSTPTTTTLRDLPSGVHVLDFAERISFARRLPIQCIPQPPPQCNDAFRLLFRGTYLVKYGRQGQPHERYLAFRLVESELNHDSQPYLVWSSHAEASSFKEKLHLALLEEVAIGPMCSVAFQRHLIRQDLIAGPSLNGKKTQLPTQFTFSLRFRSAGGVCRSVDCLALDEQTYHCWLMVCQYFASINTSPYDGNQLVGVESLAPDTPRSMSAASFAR